MKNIFLIIPATFLYFMVSAALGEKIGIVNNASNSMIMSIYSIEATITKFSNKHDYYMNLVTGSNSNPVVAGNELKNINLLLNEDTYIYFVNPNVHAERDIKYNSCCCRWCYMNCPSWCCFSNSCCTKRVNNEANFQVSYCIVKVEEKDEMKTVEDPKEQAKIPKIIAINQQGQSRCLIDTVETEKAKISCKEYLQLVSVSGNNSLEKEEQSVIKMGQITELSIELAVRGNDSKESKTQTNTLGTPISKYNHTPTYSWSKRVSISDRN